MAPLLCQPSLGQVCCSPPDTPDEEKRETGALSWQPMDFLGWGSSVLGAPSRWWLQLHELGTSSGSDNPSALPVTPIPAASTAPFSPGLIPGTSCLPRVCGSRLPIPASIQDSALLLPFFFPHRVQMGIKLRPLNSFALAAVLELQAAFQPRLPGAAAGLGLGTAVCWLLLPCPACPCLPPTPAPAPAAPRQGRAVVKPNQTKTCARAISASCEPCLGQRSAPARAAVAASGPQPRP